MAKVSRPRTLSNPFAHDNEQWFIAMIYGATGTGKTGLDATAPRPLILDLEKQADSTVKAVGNTFARTVTADDMDELEQIIEWLEQDDHGFQTLVVDTLWEVQRLLMERGRTKYPQRRAFERVMTQQDWGLISEDFRDLLMRLRNLPMHKVYTAHTKDRSSEEEVVQPLLQGKQMVSLAQRYAHLQGYMFLEEDGETGETNRYLLTKGTATIAAKNRGEWLPPTIKNPDLTKIFRRMRGPKSRKSAVSSGAEDTSGVEVDEGAEE